MQKKQVKIMGFQAENCKLKLFYETDGEDFRYIVEKNRKYLWITQDFEFAKRYFINRIWDYKNQLKLNL